MLSASFAERLGGETLTPAPNPDLFPPEEQRQVRGRDGPSLVSSAVF
jgi:hypothetical protein